MAHKNSFRRKVNDYLYDHPIQKGALHYSWLMIVTVFSAFLFAFGFRAFIAPTVAENRLVSGGVSGISQAIIAAVELFSGHAIAANNIYDIVYSVLYFSINVPIFFLAWKGIGRRFAIFTLINVGLASLFTSLLRFADDSFFNVITEFINGHGGLATRALLGGICTGVSSAVAYKIDTSAGGMDVVAYYIALKKSRLVGRYSVYINIVTVTIYTLLSITDAGWGTARAAEIFVATLLSVLYLFVTMFVIDAINIRNKKCRIQVVTEMKDLSKVLIGTLPHGATVLTGKGAYTEKDKIIITMVVSSYEVKQSINVIREADPNAFVEVVELKAVYGRFFLAPIR